MALVNLVRICFNYQYSKKALLPSLSSIKNKENNNLFDNRTSFVASYPGNPGNGNDIRF